MNLDKFTGPGSTPSRRKFWDKVQQAVMASQKTQGRNASVDEREGQGTVINFPDQTPSTSGTGACCFSDGSCSIETAAECESDGGFYLGDGTSCDDCPCCSMSSITLHVRLTGCVHIVTGDCGCLTFDCTYDKTWTCPDDFSCYPCSGNQTVELLNVDNSGCFTCSGGRTPTGFTDLHVTIFPFSGPPSVEVNIDPSFICGTNFCGITHGGHNLGVTDDWPSEKCPINVYTWSGDSNNSGEDVHYEITLTIA